MNASRCHTGVTLTPAQATRIHENSISHGCIPEGGIAKLLCDEPEEAPQRAHTAEGGAVRGSLGVCSRKDHVIRQLLGWEVHSRSRIATARGI